jgi:winged helix DNA-binding protein
MAATTQIVDLDRRRLLARRAALHGLHGGRTVAELDVLATGVQDAPSGSADLALALRTGDPRAGESPELVRVLSVRGAPHVHRRAGLPMLRRELRPQEPADLGSWLGGHGPAFLKSEVDALAVVDQVVELLIERFPGERATKGELSGAISPLLPAPARPWCAGCGTEHVIENLFRLGTLLAGLVLERGDRKLVFRKPAEPATADESTPDGSLVRAFVRHAGPVEPADVHAWLIAGGLPNQPIPASHGWDRLAGGLVAVRVDGRSLLMPGDLVDAIDDAPDPPRVVLLPPRDPFLAGNRGVLVPDRELAKQVWRPQVSPGVLVVDGEVRGTWRQRVSGRTISLHLTVSGKPPRGIKAAVGEQADLVAAVRGAGALEPQVVWDA